MVNRLSGWNFSRRFPGEIGNRLGFVLANGFPGKVDDRLAGLQRSTEDAPVPDFRLDPSPLDAP
jgi:hypothetical protein